MNSCSSKIWMVNWIHFMPTNPFLSRSLIYYACLFWCRSTWGMYIEGKIWIFCLYNPRGFFRKEGYSKSIVFFDIYILIIFFMHLQLEISTFNIQPWPLALKRLLNKPYENEVTLTWQNPPLKCYQPLEL